MIFLFLLLKILLIKIIKIIKNFEIYISFKKNKQKKIFIFINFQVENLMR